MRMWLARRALVRARRKLTRLESSSHPAVDPVRRRLRQQIRQLEILTGEMR